MLLTNLIDKILSPTPTPLARVIIIISLALMMTLSYLIVYVQGGTHLAFTHLFYIPIFLSGLLFAYKGGIISGILSGILIGPFMLDDRFIGTVQPVYSWMTRLGIFVCVGIIAAFLASILRTYLAELEAKHLTDPQTNLPNFYGLKKHFLAFREKEKLAIIIAELTPMISLERSLGQEQKSKLIRKAAHLLREMIGNMGHVGYLQNERFAMLIPYSYLEEIKKRGETIFSHSYVINDVPLFIEMRFGVSYSPQNGRDLSLLLRKAQAALEDPRQQMQTIAVFNSQSEDISSRNLFILHQLKKALNDRSLALHYQPIICTKTEQIIGMESLIRWTDPILGPLSPSEFIPLAERTLLINPLTLWLVEEALKQLKMWHELFPHFSPYISLNFSMTTLNDRQLFQRFEQITKSYNIPPHNVMLEVTESAFCNDFEIMKQILSKLKAKGFKIAIDDFGTGHASQEYLYHIPIDVLKIDAAFVERVDDDLTSQAILKSIIYLGHELKHKLIAEGVENQKQFSFLKKYKCDYVQGHYFAKAMPPSEMTLWLQQHQKPE